MSVRCNKSTLTLILEQSSNTKIRSEIKLLQSYFTFNKMTCEEGERRTEIYYVFTGPRDHIWSLLHT